jgi:GNAT superfamily N-acetyltransferase
MENSLIIYTPLVRASKADLAAAVQENLFALFRLMTCLPGSELEESEKLSRHLAFPYNPMFKGVWRTHLEKEDLGEAIPDTIEWFKSRQVPFFFWWTGPGTTPPELDQALRAHGLISMAEQAKELSSGIRSTEAGAPGMIEDLHQMNEAVLRQVPEGFTIEDVLNEQSLSDFKRVIMEGYQMPEMMADGWIQAARAAGISRTPWRMLLGRLNGEPVASTLIVKGAGVTGVNGVGTVPSMRGKGIGGAITLKPLLDARAEGYHYAVLFASDMAVHAYERIGFQPCGIRINRFLWRNQ